MLRLAPLLLVGCLAFLVGVGPHSCGDLAKFDYWHPWGRAFWQRSEAVVEALGIELGDTVADIGAGDGYFVPLLSRAVGPEGQVIAVDVTDQTIAQLVERVAREKLDNVRIIRGELDEPRLPEEAVDVILLVNTYHHIDEREDYFRRLLPALASGGRVAVIDPNGDLEGFLRFGLTEGHASAGSQVRSEMRAAGYGLQETLEILPFQIFELFAVDRP